jgi:hypothetical protein
VDPRTKSSLLWGAVGVLAFLVSAQAYQLVVGPLRVGVPVLAGVTVAVGAVVAAVSYVAEHRLTSKGRT